MGKFRGQVLDLRLGAWERKMGAAGGLLSFSLTSLALRLLYLAIS
jgi:hypothetical protein